MADSDPTFEAYRYSPSLGAAVTFIVLFILTTAFHLYQMAWTRMWYFIPFVFGGFFEWIGYIGRAVSSKQTPNWTIGPYIVQNLFLVLAPALFAASTYMELGRIMLLVDGEQFEVVKKHWLTKLFGLGDVLSFLTQSIGGSIMASGTLSAMQTGAHIVVGGLLIQLLFFGFFVTVAVLFAVKIQQHPTPRSPDPSIPWQENLKALYVVSVSIMIRSVFRVIEYVQGNDGYSMHHEYYLYIFDALLMLAVMLVFNVVHPSEVQALLRGGKVSKGFKVVELKGIHSVRPLPLRRLRMLSVD